MPGVECCRKQAALFAKIALGSKNPTVNARYMKMALEHLARAEDMEIGQSSERMAGATNAWKRRKALGLARARPNLRSYGLQFEEADEQAELSAIFASLQRTGIYNRSAMNLQ